MSWYFILLSILYVIGCIALIVIILLQKKRTAGIGGVMGGMGTSQTYWDKNKGRSMEGQLEKYTKIGGALLFVFSLLLCFIH